MNSTRRVSSISVAATDRDILRRLVAQLPAAGGARWIWSDDGDAEVLIIDVDTVSGHMDWLRARAAGYAIIAMTSHGGGSHASVLRRPLDAQGLAQALAAVDSALPASGAKPAVLDADSGAAPACSTASSVAAIADAALAPSLLDILDGSLLTECARLVRADLPSLTLDLANASWFGPSSLRAIESYCSGGIARREWERVSPAVMEGLRASGAAQPLSRLAWFVTLVNSGGRLRPELATGQRLSLARWPQIEREFPHHFRVATTLMKQPFALDDLVAACGVPRTEVIDFVNAYHRIGVIAVEATAAQSVAERVAA